MKKQVAKKIKKEVFDVIPKPIRKRKTKRGFGVNDVRRAKKIYHKEGIAGVKVYAQNVMNDTRRTN